MLDWALGATFAYQSTSALAAFLALNLGFMTVEATVGVLSDSWQGRRHAAWRLSLAGVPTQLGRLLPRRRSDARLLQADELSDAEIVRAGSGHVVLDHVDRASGAENWEMVLHLLNLVREQGHTILLLARQAPSGWPVELADLRSRLGAIQAVAISEPEDQLLSAVLLKLLTDRQIRASKDVVAYVAARIERSYAAADRVAAALDAQALGEQRALTVPLARRVLEMLSADRAE